jgi:hypothetical protein
MIPLPKSIAAVEEWLSKPDGAQLSLTFHMTPDIRALLLNELRILRDALRRTQEVGQ